MKKIITLFAMALLFIASASAQKATKLEVSFNYEKQAGGGSNQYAVWIEDAKGRVVKTLFVTAFTTKEQSITRNILNCRSSINSQSKPI